MAPAVVVASPQAMLQPKVSLAAGSVMGAVTETATPKSTWAPASGAVIDTLGLALAIVSTAESLVLEPPSLAVNVAVKVPLSVQVTVVFRDVEALNAQPAPASTPGPGVADHW